MTSRQANEASDSAGAVSNYEGRVAVFDTRIGLLFIAFGPLPRKDGEQDPGFTAECRRLRKIIENGRLGKEFNPGQPRIPAGQPGGGEWTDGNQTGNDDEADSTGWLDSVAAQTGYAVIDIPNARPSDSDDLLVEAADLKPATPQQQAKFVHDHLDAAADAADALGVPTENVLGLAALESS